MKCGHYRLSIKPTEPGGPDSRPELIGACILIVVFLAVGIFL